MPQFLHLSFSAFTLQPLPPCSLTVCHDNPSSKPLGPSLRADPSSRWASLSTLLPFFCVSEAALSQAKPRSLQEAFLMTAPTLSPLLSSLALMQETGGPQNPAIWIPT